MIICRLNIIILIKKEEIFILTIETFILVTVWKNPFVFQGSFTITNQQNNTKKVLVFRCECYFNDKNDIQKDFSPSDYKFSSLYNEYSPLYLEDEDNDDEHSQALYLLKYALKATLEQLIARQSQYFTYLDEIASSSISKEIKNYMDIENKKNIDDHIGFAVSIDFKPIDNEGKTAAYALLNIDKYMNPYKNNSSLH